MKKPVIIAVVLIIIVLVLAMVFFVVPKMTSTPSENVSNVPANVSSNVPANTDNAASANQATGRSQLSDYTNQNSTSNQQSGNETTANVAEPLPTEPTDPQQQTPSDDGTSSEQPAVPEPQQPEEKPYEPGVLGETETYVPSGTSLPAGAKPVDQIGQNEYVPPAPIDAPSSNGKYDNVTSEQLANIHSPMDLFR